MDQGAFGPQVWRTLSVMTGRTGRLPCRESVLDTHTHSVKHHVPEETHGWGNRSFALSCNYTLSLSGRPPTSGSSQSNEKKKQRSIGNVLMFLHVFQSEVLMLLSSMINMCDAIQN